MRGKKFISFLWKKQIAVFAVSATIVGFISAFDIIPEKYGVLCCIMTILLSGSIATVWACQDMRDSSKLTRKIDDREASKRSLKRGYRDRTHKFFYILRQDLLNYNTAGSNNGNDFVSFRVLKGINASRKPSDGIVYLECTEYKSNVKDIQITAVDLKTKKRLKVVFIDRNDNVKYHEFPFKIYFPAPLQPGEEFEVAYYINLVNELKVLREDDEIMSICLSRYKKGVDELEFNVCLNFDPTSVSIEHMKGNSFYLDESKAIVEKYVPKTELEKSFDIQWSAPPYIIRWRCRKPKYDFYAINYRK